VGWAMASTTKENLEFLLYEIEDFFSKYRDRDRNLDWAFCDHEIRVKS
jgi:hypothetical protein